MNRPTIREHQVETNQVVDREMNDAEFTQWQKDLEETIAKEQAAAEALAKRAATFAKLEALGLDEDDLKALGL